MLSKFRRSVMPKKEAGPAATTYHTPSRPGEPCHACGRPMPSMAELPPSPPLTASPPPSVGDDYYYFEDNIRQNEEAWSSLNNSNHHSSNNNNNNNSIITPATSKPEIALGLQFRSPGRRTSSIYSPQTPVSSGKDAGWYSRTNMARSGQVRPLSTAIERVDEDSEYALDLPKRTLSNYSQSFETPGSRAVSNDEQMLQQQLPATPPTQPLRFPRGLAILAAQESGPAAPVDEDISPSNVEAPANNLPPPPPMPMGAPPPPPPRWRRRTISNMFRRDSKPSSIKSRGRRSISSLY